MLDSISTDELNSIYPDINFYEYLTTGGQKKVYMGKSNGEEVVIKLLPTNGVSSSRRAEREISCLQDIKSKNIVELKKCFKDVIHGNNIIVMVEEYVDGETLRDKIDKEPSLNLAIDVVETLLELLTCFEEKGIVHRDIKPENIIMNKERGPVLLDFGIARVLNEESITETSMPMAPGTIPYSAPEQLTNKKVLQGVRTDIFSTGIVFFETATGEYPYEYEDLESLIQKIITGERRNIMDYLDNCPCVGLINKLYMKMTHPNLFERFRKPEFAFELVNQIKEEIKNEE